MSDIQVHFTGDDKARQEFESLIAQYCGGEAIIQTIGGAMQAVTAVSLILTVSTLLASPKGIFQQLAQHQQSGFLEHLQQFVRQHNVELVFTLPNGQRVDLQTINIEELREMLNQLPG